MSFLISVRGAHARGAAADLRELETLGSKEPLHVGGRGLEAEELDDLAPHHFDLFVARRGVDPIGGDELR